MSCAGLAWTRWGSQSGNRTAAAREWGARRLCGGARWRSSFVALAALDSDGRRLRSELGRAGLPVQPGDVGASGGSNSGKCAVWINWKCCLIPLTLLYYWPYGRYGINFHPPLAGQLNLASYAIFGHWLKDIPARRMATVIEFALTIVIGFHFLARRYGVWVGLVMAGVTALDAAGLWPGPFDRHGHAGAVACGRRLRWRSGRGFTNRGRGRWRVAVGILLGLAFIEKLSAVVVLVPLLLWMVAAYLPRTRSDRGRSLTGSMVC